VHFDGAFLAPWAKWRRHNTAFDESGELRDGPAFTILQWVGRARDGYAALVCNLAIVSVKFMVYGVSRSSAMLAETIHSLADSLDQILLLLGESRGRRPPDADNPLGDGMETRSSSRSWFSSLVAALRCIRA